VVFTKLKRLNGREMKALFILSIVVPLGFLTTLRLTGILPEPITETTTLETIKWEFQRPNQSVILDETLKSQYSSGEISTITRIRIGKYANDDPILGDFVTLGVSTNLTTIVPNTFVASVYVVLDMDNQSSIGWLITDGISYDAENLSLTGYAGGHQGLRAYVSLKGVEQPKSAYFSAGTYWFLRTPHSQTHQLEVAYELTYYNGTAYKKVVQPFQLKLL